MVFGRKKKNHHGLAALATATIKLAKAQVVLDKTEAALERELEKEAKSVPKTKLQRVRKKGEHLIHSKHILLLIVLLNLIDCLLVLGELMLDIKYVTDLLTKEHYRSNMFIESMSGLYPTRLGYLQPGDIEILEHEILEAHLTWDSHGSSHVDSHGSSHVDSHGSSHVDSHGSSHDDPHGSYPANMTDSTPQSVTPTTQLNVTPTSVSPSSYNQTEHQSRRRRAAGTSDGTNTGNAGEGNHDEHHAEHGHSIEEEIAHALHKASITILGILVAETFCKVFFLGKDMLDHKLECFDGVIVLASFIVDLVLLEGLQQFTVQEFVLILAFLVPWRIIRVVNSLVVAIMDHEHFRLKVLYKQKKKISQDLKYAKTDIKGLEACVSALETMCKEAGIPETNVKAKLLLYRKAQKKSSAMHALAGFAIGGDMMKKQISEERKKQEHSVTVDIGKTNTENMEKHENPTVIGNVGELVKQSAEVACDIIQAHDSPPLYTLRLRSHSAVETREVEKHTFKHQTSSEFLARLAETSAGFIATIHKDDLAKRPSKARIRSSSQLKNIEENKGLKTNRANGMATQPGSEGGTHTSSINVRKESGNETHSTDTGMPQGSASDFVLIQISNKDMQRQPDKEKDTSNDTSNDDMLDGPDNKKQSIKVVGGLHIPDSKTEKVHVEVSHKPDIDTQQANVCISQGSNNREETLNAEASETLHSEKQTTTVNFY